MVDLNKEKEPLRVGREKAPEEFPTVESPRKNESQDNLETTSWIEKIEKRLGRIPQGQPGPADDQVVVQQPQSNQPPVKLPVTQSQIKNGKRLKAEFSLAWLVGWAIRQIKMMTKMGRKVELAEIPEVKEKEL